MKVLYYSWEEITKDDMLKGFANLGIDVVFEDCPISDYLSDSKVYNIIKSHIERENVDFIFTFNFIPVIAKVSYSMKVNYIAWIYDSPHLTLHSEMIYSPYTHIFHFDMGQCQRFAEKGVKNIYHLPLAVDIDRLSGTFPKGCEFLEDDDYENEISFMGNLYEKGTLELLRQLPDYLKGYIDGAMNVQMNVYGYDLIRTLCESGLGDEIMKYIPYKPEDELKISNADIAHEMLVRELGGRERKKMLGEALKVGNVSFYTPSNYTIESDTGYTFTNKGPLKYMVDMPWAFYKSKINLNTTLRSIGTGIPLRALDIMGAGGFLLTNYQAELAEYFVDGEELVMYENFDDMKNKIKYYLAHADERKKIAANGREKVRQLFSYEERIKTILEFVESLKLIN